MITHVWYINLFTFAVALISTFRFFLFHFDASATLQTSITAGLLSELIWTGETWVFYTMSDITEFN